jgi:hypothetical protein
LFNPSNNSLIELASFFWALFYAPFLDFFFFKKNKLKIDGSGMKRMDLIENMENTQNNLLMNKNPKSYLKTGRNPR